MRDPDEAIQHIMDAGAAMTLTWVVSTSICPTCGKGPGRVCHVGGRWASVSGSIPFIHGTRLNRVWRQLHRNNPFRKERLYALMNDHWREIMVDSKWAEEFRLYTAYGRLRGKRRRRHK